MIPHRVRISFALAIVTFTWSASAQQGLRDRDPNLSVTRKITSELQQAWLHSGPFYLTSRLQLSDIGYDQHFFLPSDTGGLRWAVSAPQRLYIVPTRKIVASIEAAPSLALVQRGAKKFQFGFTSRADLQFIFNRLWLDFHTGIFNDLRASTGEINRVLTAKENDYTVDGEFKYSSRTNLTYSASSRRTRFPTNRVQPEDVIDALPLLDRSEHDYRVAVRHQTFPLTTITLASEVSNYSFDQAPYRNASRTYGAIGADFDNGPTAIRAEVATARLDFKDPAQKDFTGLLGNASASRRIGRRMNGEINVVRDLDFSIYLFNNYYLTDRLGGTLGYDVSRRLQVRALAQLGRDLYQTPVNGIFREDKMSFVGAGWNYGRRHIQGGFDVGYYRRTSNVHIDESHGIRLLLHLSLAL